MTNKKQLNIIHFYPDLLNLYGDKGNISALKMRLKWRGIDCNITTVRSADPHLTPTDKSATLSNKSVTLSNKSVTLSVAEGSQRFLDRLGMTYNVTPTDKSVTLSNKSVTLSVAEGSHEGDRPDDFNLSDADIVFLGGGLDKEQRLVSEALLKHKADFIRYVEDGGVILAVCGGYQMLGKYYMAEGEKVEGLGLLDIYSEAKKDRIIGNVVLETELFSQKIVGFENHSAITYIGEGKPLGKVLCGGGNTGDGGYEGIIYKNIIGTNLHGPLLPKNPMLCDYILSAAMARKYNNFTGFKTLNDEVEVAANEYIVNRFTT